MSTINVDDFDGLRNITPGSGDKTLAKVLQDVADDVEALRAAHDGAMAKLDLDATVTDTDYQSLWGVATGTILTKKGRT